MPQGGTPPSKMNGMENGRRTFSHTFPEAPRVLNITSSDCLIVVDVQNGFLNEFTMPVVPAITHLLDTVAFQHRVFTRFHNTPASNYEKLMNWTRFRSLQDTAIPKGLAEYASVIIDKDIYTSCVPEFLTFLQVHSISRCFVCGIDTDVCVLKTAVDLFEAQYEPYVLADLCASHGGHKFHQAALEILPRLIGRNQIVTDSLSVLRNSVVS